MFLSNLMSCEKSTGKTSSSTTTTAFVLIATIVFLSASFVQCHDSGTKQQIVAKSSKRATVRVCGIKLVDTLKKLCNHCYRVPQFARNVRATENDGLDVRQEYLNAMKRLDDESYASSASDEIDSYIDKRLGNRRIKTSGIANKCCINQCGWTDLKSYCCKRPEVQMDMQYQ